MTYASPEEVKRAESLGYEWNTDTRRGCRFKQGVRHVWGTASGWQTADLLPGEKGVAFSNHQPFDSLADALRRPL